MCEFAVDLRRVLVWPCGWFRGGTHPRVLTWLGRRRQAAMVLSMEAVTTTLLPRGRGAGLRVSLGGEGIGVSGFYFVQGTGIIGPACSCLVSPSRLSSSTLAVERLDSCARTPPRRGRRATSTRAGVEGAIRASTLAMARQQISLMSGLAVLRAATRPTSCFLPESSMVCVCSTQAKQICGRGSTEKTACLGPVAMSGE